MLVVPRLCHLKRLRARGSHLDARVERVEGVCAGLKESLVVIDEQHVDGFQLRVLDLVLCDGHVEGDRECRPLPFLALALDLAAHEVNHLLSDGKAETRALHAVHAAVGLARERLVHALHELLAHTDARIGHAVDKAHHSRCVARQLLQVDDNGSVGLGVLEGVGQDVDEHLVDAQLVGVEVLVLHDVGAEVEVDILILDHGLRNVDEVLGHLHDREDTRRERELATLHFGYVQDVVDEREQVVARDPNLTQAVLDDGLVVNVALCDSRQTQNRVHGRADVMGHGREEVALGAICRLGFPGSLIKALVKPIHKGHVRDEQDQQGAGNPTDQEPVNGASTQVIHLDVVQNGPSLVCANRRIRNQALLAARVGHEE